MKIRRNLFAAALLALPALQGLQAAPVLMISIDGLRPDYVTQADAHGLKIPNLRRFIKEGTYADGVIGVVPTVTYPSHTTLEAGMGWAVSFDKGDFRGKAPLLHQLDEGIPTVLHAFVTADRRSIPRSLMCAPGPRAARSRPRSPFISRAPRPETPRCCCRPRRRT